MTAFSDFMDELRAVTNQNADFDERKAFRSRHAKLLAEMMVCLDEMGVIGANSLHINPPSLCDLCSVNLFEQALFIDGETRQNTQPHPSPDGKVRDIGEWANMCFGCFSKVGVALGWGSGQLYVLRTNNEWQCIAGGNPSTEDEE